MNSRLIDKLRARGYRVRPSAGGHGFDVITRNGVAIEDAVSSEDEAWSRALNDFNAEPNDRMDPAMRTEVRNVRKLTKADLRRVIMSEVKKLREGGDPLGDDGIASECAAAVAEAFADANPYDDDDGMGDARGGPVAWAAQVTDAAEALEEELLGVLQPILMDYQRRLDEGEFGRG
jgi:hypothetical protein